MRKNKLVSIIIRTKNEENWISLCLDKIFKQNYKNFEVIIVDNNSTDNSLGIVNTFDFEDIKVYNMLGKLVLEEKASRIKLNKGIYLIKISKQNLNLTTKLIVE